MRPGRLPVRLSYLTGLSHDGRDRRIKLVAGIGERMKFGTLLVISVTTGDAVMINLADKYDRNTFNAVTSA